MIVRRARADEWRELRRLRLEALADAPLAFGSTLAREAAHDEARWRSEAAAAAAGTTAVAVVATDARGRWLAMARGQLDGEAQRGARPVVWLIGVYTTPGARGGGLARATCAGVVAWAAEVGAAELRLHVGAENAPARRVYEDLGFVPTGAFEQLAHDPSVVEHEMVLPVRDRPLD